MNRLISLLSAILLAGCSLESKPESIVNPKAGPEPTPRVDYPAEPEAPEGMTSPSAPTRRRPL